MQRKNFLKFIFLSGTLLLFSCIEDTEVNYDMDSEETRILVDGKSDNYYSNIAVEYEVHATLPVQMTAEQYNNEVVRNDIINRRITAFGLYLTAYLREKSFDLNGDGQITGNEILAANYPYGGFHAMARNRAVEDIQIIGNASNGYQVTFTIDIAGPSDLLLKIPAASGSSDTEFLFDLRQPKGATVDSNNVSGYITVSFNPDTYRGELETIRCAVTPLPTIGNAYPNYSEFVSDGIYDITLFFGYDYNSERYDIIEARQFYQKLIDLGFQRPRGVHKFEDLKSDSGSFVFFMASYNTRGKDRRFFNINVRIFHSDMFINNRRQQHDLALQEITSRDVFFYIGHAAPYLGFYLDANNEAYVSPQEFRNAPFTDKQQLFVAQGCMSYSQYADMLYANPIKDESNLDVITTVNYGIMMRGTSELFENLVKIDSSRKFIPVDYYSIIRAVNSNYIINTYNVFYGVMGIEGNPHLHPFANVENIGKKCYGSDFFCGGEFGNLCIMYSDNIQRCTVKSLSSSACPEGTRFNLVSNGEEIEYGVCIQQN